MDGWLKRQMSGITGPGPIFTDLVKGEDIFTYGGPTRNNPDKIRRRNDADCKNFRKRCPSKFSHIPSVRIQWLA
jgi:hypothetical protein